MTSTALPPMSDGVLIGIAQAIGEHYSGSQIDNLLRAAHLDGSEVSTKWRRVHDVFVREQASTGSGNCVIALLRQAVVPQSWASYPAGFTSLRDSVNRHLAFEGLRVREDGRVARIKVATTIGEAAASTSRRLHDELVRRGVHSEVFRYCAQELVAEDCFTAVFEAVKGLANRIREMAGVDLDGGHLVDEVFGGSTPRVALNTLRTETERNEQRGLASLMRGAISAFRNPAAHEPKILWHVSEPDALDLLTMLSLIHRRLDTAQVIRSGTV
jgi:uncharacterized protein (TIGR02391 family)